MTGWCSSSLRAGVTPEIRRPFLGEALGEVDGTVAGSVVYGGPVQRVRGGQASFPA